MKVFFESTIRGKNVPGDEGFFFNGDDEATERGGVDDLLEGGQELGGS